jgi:AcrR family transcriptional regulator
VTTKTLSARERLLAAADELFYEEGVHTVGIDRVIERAGVAKASLYNTFGSKDELIRAYLSARHARRQERTLRGLDRYDTPRGKILGVFDLQAEMAAQPTFRGCAFLNASAESQPGDVVQQVSDESRAWMRELFTDLAAQAGATDPGALAAQLVVLYDGGNAGVRMDRDRAAVMAARSVAELVLDAAL